MWLESRKGCSSQPWNSHNRVRLNGSLLSTVVLQYLRHLFSRILVLENPLFTFHPVWFKISDPPTASFRLSLFLRRWRKMLPPINVRLGWGKLIAGVKAGYLRRRAAVSLKKSPYIVYRRYTYTKRNQRTVKIAKFHGAELGSLDHYVSAALFNVYQRQGKCIYQSFLFYYL